MFALGAVVAGSGSSGAAPVTGPYAYYSGRVPAHDNNVDTYFIRIHNPTGSAQDVTVKQRRVDVGAATEDQTLVEVASFDRTIPPGHVLSLIFDAGIAVNNNVRSDFVIYGKTDQLVPDLAYVPFAASGQTPVQFEVVPAGSWRVVGPNGGAQAGANNTQAFCAEGSVRNDSNGVLQMYVTLFSKTPQSVTINYITNAGTFPHSVSLVAGVRLTDDVNAFLIGGGVPALNGRTDVDTSVEVLGSDRLFLACPVYFNRSIGMAGPVNGGTVQDGSHN